MPIFHQNESQGFYGDKSQLSPGWRPAMLLMVTEESRPEHSKTSTPTRYRWHFAVWNSLSVMASQAPEHQTGLSSTIFSSGGRHPASKSYQWTTQLLGRRPDPGEAVDLDPLLPLPCRVKIAREKEDGTPIEYANILDLEAPPEEMQRVVTTALHAALVQLTATWQAQTPPAPPGAPQVEAPQAEAPPQATHPGFAGWGNPKGTVTKPSAVPTW